MPCSTPKIISNGGTATAAISIKEGLTAVTTVQGSDPDGDKPLSTRSSGALTAISSRSTPRRALSPFPHRPITASRPTWREQFYDWWFKWLMGH